MIMPAKSSSVTTNSQQRRFMIDIVKKQMLQSIMLANYQEK